MANVVAKMNERAKIISPFIFSSIFKTMRKTLNHPGLVEDKNEKIVQDKAKTFKRQ